jgi:hypothetical protein
MASADPIDAILKLSMTISPPITEEKADVARITPETVTATVVLVTLPILQMSPTPMLNPAQGCVRTIPENLTVARTIPVLAILLIP